MEHSCNCPADGGVIRHQRATCTDGIVAWFGWYADGTRRIKLSKDSYDFWRARCHGCGWPGSPWPRRSEAVAEFEQHDCERDAAFIPNRRD